jgi:predicted DNA-binding WGR domain protein
MAEEKTYLELSQTEGSHKFYEAILNGTEVSIRYGRIGDRGQMQVKSYPTAEKAKAEGGYGCPCQTFCHPPSNS